jgi:hypothetical protein
MGIDSTPFDSTYDFEDKERAEDLLGLFGDPFTDVTSYLNGILYEVNQEVVDELFKKISSMN